LASRRKNEDERATEEPVDGTLAAEVLRALRRLLAYEGSISATARVLRTISPSLRLSRQRLTRWLERGIPSESLEGDALGALLFALYTRFAQLDVNQPARDARELKMRRNREAIELLETYGNRRERERLLGGIRGWVRRHEQVAKFRREWKEGSKWVRKSGARVFAEELGVRVDLLKATLRDGTVSVKLFQKYREFEAREAEQAVEDAIDARKMAELMALASVPEKTVVSVKRRRKVWEDGREVTRDVWVDEERQEPVIPKIPNGSWDFTGEGTHGRRWGKKIGQYLLPRIHPSGKDGWAVVERIVEFALAVPGLSPPERFPVWNVYALASELGDELSGGSKKQYRDLDHEDGRRFVVDEAYSGGSRKGARARERTLWNREPDPKTGSIKKGFVQHIGEALDGTSVLYVHGAIAWNFRYRDLAEQERREKIRKEKVDLQKVIDRVRARVSAEAKAKAVEREKLAKKKAKRNQTLAALMARRAEKQRTADGRRPTSRKRRETRKKS